MLMNSDPLEVLSVGWIWLGVYCLAGVIFGGLSARSALERGYPPLPAFLLGFAFNVPAYLYYTFRAPNPAGAPLQAGTGKYRATLDPIACPQCGHPNHPSASHCSGCDALLEARIQSEVRTVK
jgi:hypothetical protein